MVAFEGFYCFDIYCSFVFSFDIYLLYSDMFMSKDERKYNVKVWGAPHDFLYRASCNVYPKVELGHC